MDKEIRSQHHWNVNFLKTKLLSSLGDKLTILYSLHHLCINCVSMIKVTKQLFMSQ